MTEPGDDLQLSYRAALDELDEILEQLEASTVDVDVLAARVARGAELVGFCRSKLRTVRRDVEAVVDELVGAPSLEHDAAADGAEDNRSR